MAFGVSTPPELVWFAWVHRLHSHFITFETYLWLTSIILFSMRQRNTTTQRTKTCPESSHTMHINIWFTVNFRNENFWFVFLSVSREFARNSINIHSQRQIHHWATEWQWWQKLCFSPPEPLFAQRTTIHIKPLPALFRFFLTVFFHGKFKDVGR